MYNECVMIAYDRGYIFLLHVAFYNYIPWDDFTATAYSAQRVKYNTRIKGSV